MLSFIIDIAVDRGNFGSRPHSSVGAALALVLAGLGGGSFPWIGLATRLP